MDTQQADAIVRAALAPDLHAQERRTQRIQHFAAAARDHARKREPAWCALAGLLVGVPLAWATGAAVGQGALLGVAAGCVLGRAGGWVYTKLRAR